MTKPAERPEPTIIMVPPLCEHHNLPVARYPIEIFTASAVSADKHYVMACPLCFDPPRPQPKSDV